MMTLNIDYKITNSDVDDYIDSVSQDTESNFYRNMKFFFRDEILDHLDARDQATAEGLK